MLTGNIGEGGKDTAGDENEVDADGELGEPEYDDEDDDWYDQVLFVGCGTDRCDCVVSIERRGWAGY